ncbi:hypothetical protein ABZ770_44385 [Streptomyces sp. NPDC006654]|uniref:hypothetical protein n=1 Tax=Streptomyces sp. NPDC006654 TaxID=3156897 RepID=UPI0033CEA93F
MPATLREVETTARQRQRRTRSRAVSHLEALAVSSLKPHEYDLHPESVSLVCPSCRTWVPIHIGTKAPNAKAEPKAKLVAHHTEKAGTENPRRCPGSHRLIVIDMDIERWWQRLEEGVSETDSRRATRVTRKPKVAVAPAVTQIVAPMLSADGTLKLFRTHAQQCEVCQESGHAHCPEGSPLVRLYLYKLRNAPAVEALARKTREEEESEVLAEDRGPQWVSTADSVRQADLQRVQDVLEATLRQHSEKLNDWERADLMSAITMLVTKVEQLTR